MPEHQQIQQSKKTNIIFQNQATPVRQTPVSNPYSIIQRAKINPRSLTRADIMQLHRTIGNQAVGRLLSSIGNSSTAQQAPVQRQEMPEEEEPLQGKMIETIQRQEIPEEEEPLQGKMVGTIQRQEIPEEEEPLQGKFIEAIQRQEIPEEEEPLQGKMIGIVQRQEIPEEEEPLQGKMAETLQRQEIPEEEEPLQTKRENNTGMPDNLKAGVENLSGIDISDVKVHYNSPKPAEVGALAYTQGTNIHVAPGQEKHLSHESWHVVQQAQGRVRPTLQLKDIMVNDDVGLEAEADVMGRRAVQAKGNIDILRSLSINHKTAGKNSKVVQCAGPPRRHITSKQRRKILLINLLPILTGIISVAIIYLFIFLRRRCPSQNTPGTNPVCEKDSWYEIISKALFPGFVVGVLLRTLLDCLYARSDTYDKEVEAEKRSIQDKSIEERMRRRETQQRGDDIQIGQRLADLEHITALLGRQLARAAVPSMPAAAGEPTSSLQSQTRGRMGTEMQEKSRPTQGDSSVEQISKKKATELLEVVVNKTD